MDFLKIIKIPLIVSQRRRILNSFDVNQTSISNLLEQTDQTILIQLLIQALNAKEIDNFISTYATCNWSTLKYRIWLLLDHLMNKKFV